MIPTLADVPFVIRAGLVWYAPVDFEDQSLFNHDDRPDFVDRFRARITPEEVSPEERLRRYREMSPVRYLTGDSPPLMMIQGDRDTTIPVKHAYRMRRQAEAVGAPTQVMIVKHAGHNWRRKGADIDPAFGEIIERTVRFYVDANAAGGADPE